MDTSIKILHWAPRILCILAILFISLFALDSFGSNRTIAQQIADFFMHLIPSFGLIILLVIAWKWEFIGGIIFILIGLGFSPFIFKHNYNMNQSVDLSLQTVFIIAMPFVLVGILFIVSHYKKRNQQTA